ncbi:unnamed protein product, partial [Ceratitis capitata]
MPQIPSLTSKKKRAPTVQMRFIGKQGVCACICVRECLCSKRHAAAAAAAAAAFIFLRIAVVQCPFQVSDCSNNNIKNNTATPCEVMN